MSAGVKSRSSATGRRRARLSALVVAAAAVALWVSSRMTWVTALGVDDKSGASDFSIAGGTWAAELTAVALALLAGAVGILALRRGGRRVVAVVCAVLAGAVALVPLNVLTAGADPERVRSLLTNTAGELPAASEKALAGWAELAAVDVHVAGPAVAIVAAAVALVAAVVAAVRPGSDPDRATRFAKGSQRRARIDRSLQEHPESGRVMWDALDADIDPTAPTDRS
ncbi:TIGR02234 family membrane protein [Corynebacterium atypicum]|uniref:TIGR02234 family membrane protein n=1 Tax=Corynebacterium atypicum TaxID=191610 RepID=UPI00068CEAB6|nr:TIGR02234 family membrane protein [Corynebacterium atypicum]